MLEDENTPPKDDEISPESPAPENNVNPDEMAMEADANEADANEAEAKETESPPQEEVDLQEFEEENNANPLDTQPEPEEITSNISAVYDVPVQVSAVLGRASLQVNQLLKLSRGAVIELDRKVGEAIDIFVNNRLVARGEIVVVDDHLGITMTEIIKADHHAS